MSLSLSQTVKSKTVWTVVAMFVVGGLGALQDVVPASYVPYIQAILGLFAIYFRKNPTAETK